MYPRMGGSYDKLKANLKATAMLPYDGTSPSSIETYGQRLIGSTLRKTPGVCDIPPRYLETQGGEMTKGVFGTLIEKFYYGIDPGNKACSPDFVDAGVELKTNALVKRTKGFSSKERLVLQMIDYKAIIDESFDSSCFMRKSRLMMLISHTFQESSNFVDAPIPFAGLIDWDQLPTTEQNIIREDWATIAEKVRSGRAHQLSGSDTKYLEACPKAADSSQEVSQPNSEHRAKPRAFALKAGYVTSLVHRISEGAGRPGPAEVLGVDEQLAITDAASVAADGFEATVLRKFVEFKGLEVDSIEARLGLRLYGNAIGLSLNKNAKDYRAQLARHMIGVTTKRVAEFDRAGIEIKTILLDRNGNPPEHMSFPAFKYMGPGSVLEEDWDSLEDEEAPRFKRHLEATRFLFVVYSNDGGMTTLNDVFFWSMLPEDIESFVRPVWQRTVDSILSGNLEALPGASFNEVCHVRPHAQNREDTWPTPRNGPQVKKSFWLDKKYIQKQIKEHAITEV